MVRLWLLTFFCLRTFAAEPAADHDSSQRTVNPVDVLSQGEAAIPTPAPPEELLNSLLRDLVIHAADYRKPTESLGWGKFEKKKGTVLFFIKNGCPLVKLYAERFKGLFEAYGKEFNFIVVHSNPHEDKADLDKSPLSKIEGVTVLHDPLGMIADEAEVNKVPTAMLFDADFKPLYKGPIDDQFSPGKRLPVANNEYLKSKLEALKSKTRPEYRSVKVQGCEIEPPETVESKSPITYHSHIKQIIERGACNNCHAPGEIREETPLDYEGLVNFAHTAAKRIASRQMPPWQADDRYGKFHDARRLSRYDIDNFIEWVKAGTPEGKRATGGTKETAKKSGAKADQVWIMPEPFIFRKDGSVVVPKKKVDPKTEPEEELVSDEKEEEGVLKGVIPYQYVLVDSGVAEDKWVSSVTVSPGAPKVVHHVRAFVIPPDLGKEKMTFLESTYAARYLKLRGEHLQWANVLWGRDDKEPSSTVLGSFTPGTARPFPEGTGVKIPKGSKILFELHYTPDGGEHKDQSKIEVNYSKTAPKYQMLELPLGKKRQIKIPKNDSNYSLESEFTFERKARIYSFRPHMHLRGKQFKVEKILPDGSRQTLLSLPAWDYKWQTYYELKEPLVVEPGTKIVTTSVWDNSKYNPGNPNSNVDVTFGPDIQDEMTFAYMNMAWEKE